MVDYVVVGVAVTAAGGYVVYAAAVTGIVLAVAGATDVAAVVVVVAGVVTVACVGVASAVVDISDVATDYVVVVNVDYVDAGVVNHIYDADITATRYTGCVVVTDAVVAVVYASGYC